MRSGDSAGSANPAATSSSEAPSSRAAAAAASALSTECSPPGPQRHGTLACGAAQDEARDQVVAERQLPGRHLAAEPEGDHPGVGARCHGRYFGHPRVEEGHAAPAGTGKRLDQLPLGRHHRGQRTELAGVGEAPQW